MATGLRKTGIDVLGDARWGTHFCQFYQTREDLLDILVPYFRAGLENNEFCMWVTSAPLGKDEATKALGSVVPNLDGYLRTGQIEILPHSEWYLKDGAFDAQRILNGWVDKLNGALAAGFEGLRLTGNTHWLEEADWDTFADYEQQINDVIGKYRMLAICSYALDRCGAAEILDVVSSHQFALIRRAGKWEIVESSELKRAQEEAIRQAAVLQAMNDVFREALTCQTEEELGKTCLSVAEKLTGSKFGFICEVNRSGRLDTIAISDPGWHACRIPASREILMQNDLPVQGIRGRVIQDGLAMIFNEPASHPDWIAPPEGHPTITSFLGVPLKHQGKSIGMIGLGNKEGGYAP
ncbi:MAG: MEDS domain-containing protein, partial [Phycisphaerae bacterium]|nr:MEDS domain-containing protein [Phycisphaerae bacterium]